MNQPAGMKRLQGRIAGLRKTRKERDFVLSQIGGVGLGASAVGAALGGMSGASIGIATMDTEEAADYVEFELDGRPVQGWLWRFPFQDGDTVELVGEPAGDRFVAYGVRRPEDGLVALYPHCVEGWRSHLKSNLRFWAWVFAGLYAIALGIMIVLALSRDGIDMTHFLTMVVGYSLPMCVLVFGFLAWRATAKLKGFALMSEAVFRGFGWPEPARINLRERSRARRQAGDPSGYGDFFFRY